MFALHAESIGHFYFLQQLLGIFIQSIIGPGKVAEARQPVFPGADNRAQQGATIGFTGVMQIHMPVQPTDYFFAVIAGQHKFFLRRIIDQHKQFGVLVRHGGAERVHGQCAEVTAELDLFFRCYVLVAK